jgi:hypothetical protein
VGFVLFVIAADGRRLTAAQKFTITPSRTRVVPITSSRPVLRRASSRRRT